MTIDAFLALTAFAFVSSITPGPNNFMLLASGVNFGFWRTLPHMCGIGFGFGLLILVLGAGLSALITTFPPLHIALKIIGALYLFYLAWRIATTISLKKGEGRGKPMTFFEAALFQWVNPKAWTMGLTAIALYTNPEAPLTSLILVALVFVLVNFPSVGTWTAFGTAFSAYLSIPARLKVFNRIMGLLLVLTVIPMVI